MQRSIGKGVAVRKPRTTSQPLLKRYTLSFVVPLDNFLHCVAVCVNRYGLRRPSEIGSHTEETPR